MQVRACQNMNPLSYRRLRWTLANTSMALKWGSIMHHGRKDIMKIVTNNYNYDEEDSFNILNVVVERSQRYISLSLRPRKITSSWYSLSPSETTSTRPGDLDGPVLCFFRGIAPPLVIIGRFMGTGDTLEVSSGVPIFHTKGPRRFVLDNGG